jgi:hypothetical protein
LLKKRNPARPQGGAPFLFWLVLEGRRNSHRDSILETAFGTLIDLLRPSGQRSDIRRYRCPIASATAFSRGLVPFGRTVDHSRVQCRRLLKPVSPNMRPNAVLRFMPDGPFPSFRCLSRTISIRIDNLLALWFDVELSYPTVLSCPGVRR